MDEESDYTYFDFNEMTPWDTEPRTRWSLLLKPLRTEEPLKIRCYSGCHPGLSWCPSCGWEKGKDCPRLEWPERCDACEQYPEKPVPPEPDPNQLTFPWMDSGTGSISPRHVSGV